ncbi:APC family permease [Bartonella sp. HY329]|uniref:APC family permease n=1 Tax=unclassified Bartonella TaxID=2645622 RepID=UPI0021C86B72|nr:MULTISPECIES: APC family permease [unclassified Bartonella]UXM94935.1 APC family permease [Bartonella sp. HY329]UXN09258.1 APC family permease [Bartonella sp. HY328]
MSDSIEKFGYEQSLNRVLTYKDLVIYGMLFMVIIAPMSIFGYISKDSHGMTPLVYLVGIICMFFTALSYMKMSSRFPIAGSVYAYVQRGINPHVGFVAGWLILLDYIFVPSLLYLMTATWCVELMPGTPMWMWIVIFIIANTLINIRGIEYTAIMDILIFLLEIVVLAIFIVIGLMYVLNGGGAGKLSIEPFYQVGKIDIQFIAAAVTIAALSFLGFDGISTLAEETKNPEKTVGRAIITALFLIGFVFILQTYVATLIQPDYTKMNSETAFFDAAYIAGGGWLKILLLVMNIIAVGIANTMAAQAASSRIIFGMARDHFLPPLLAKVHPKFKTPYISTLFIAGLSLVCATTLNIELLVKLVNFGALSSFVMLNFAVFWFFYIKEKNRKGLKNIINYVILPFIGASILGYVWLNFDKTTQIIGFTWLFIGLVIGFIISKGYKTLPGPIGKM